MKPSQSLYYEWFVAPKTHNDTASFAALTAAVAHLHDVELLDSNRGYLRGENTGAPCVVFKAPIEQIQRLNVCLMELNVQHLHYHWTLTGKLDALSQLFFRLSAHELDEKVLRNDISMHMAMGWHRARVDRDIRLLTLHINDMLPR
ncbi:hypothetical protein J7I01_002723 [Vibrio parahaemolyticus]|nr:hypothetical protein [Vibrio parahaemolyticus]